MSALLPTPRSATWKWTVCGLLFLATLLNYMDRQTLAQMAPTIRSELGLTENHYGTLEMSFGLAFAAGGLIFGLLADKINVWMLYPIVVVGWSLAGFSTGFATPIGKTLAPWCEGWLFGLLDLKPLSTESNQTYVGLLFCRIVLGMFEAGQWPCALVTTKRLLTQEDRTLGNSLLQSGGAIGAILTPVAVWLLVPRNVTGSWTTLFMAVGAVGLSWLIPWFLLIRPSDLAYREAPVTSVLLPAAPRFNFLRKYAAVACTVILINITWHFFRAWTPTFLENYHGISRDFVLWFSVAYYLVADMGCLAVGFLVKRTSTIGWHVHSGRILAFLVCGILTLAGILAGQIPGSPQPTPVTPSSATASAVITPGENPSSSDAAAKPAVAKPEAVTDLMAEFRQHWWMLLLLLIVGAGSLGVFPIYYSLSQDLSARNQGKVTGSLSCLTWIFTAVMQKWVGKTVQETNSYAAAFTVAGFAPLVACFLIWLLWPREQKPGIDGPA